MRHVRKERVAHIERMGFDERSCRGMKKGGKVVWGQRWLPVCLWNTSQLAFTVNAGKNRVPKSGQQEWVTGPEGGGKKGGDSYWREVRCLKWHAC